MVVRSILVATKNTGRLWARVLEADGLFVLRLWTRARVVASEVEFHVMDGIDERAALDRHGEVDGIEVGFTVEAAGQVGAGIDGRLGFPAERTEEGPLVATPFVRPAQRGEEPGEWDLIAKPPEVIVREEARHHGTPVWE